MTSRARPLVSRRNFLAGSAAASALVAGSPQLAEAQKTARGWQGYASSPRRKWQRSRQSSIVSSHPIPPVPAASRRGW